MVGLWAQRPWQPSKSQRGCRWALQVRTWEIARHQKRCCPVVGELFICQACSHSRLSLLVPLYMF